MYKFCEMYVKLFEFLHIYEIKVKLLEFFTCILFEFFMFIIKFLSLTKKDYSKMRKQSFVLILK